MYIVNIVYIIYTDDIGSGKTVQNWTLPWKGTAQDHYVEQWLKETFRKSRTHDGQICRCHKLNL
jgi:hypothetical protein